MLLWILEQPRGETAREREKYKDGRSEKGGKKKTNLHPLGIMGVSHGLAEPDVPMANPPQQNEITKIINNKKHLKKKLFSTHNKKRNRIFEITLKK